MELKKYIFKDDGRIPNNKLPLIIFKNVFDEREDEGAELLEDKFKNNNWKNSWRNGVHDFHHYHSNTHEVLGVYNGTALLQLGGENGEKLRVEAGDIIIIPAGVGHKNLESENFKIVGDYPNGRDYDMNYGKEGERPAADKNIAAVPIPEADPWFGEKAGIVDIWSNY